MLLGLLSSVLFTAVCGAILFASAGRWDLPLFWAYLGVWAAASVVGSLVTDPGLTQERLRPGPGGKFYLTDVLIPLLWVAQYVVAGLDVGRFHWSDTVPLPVQVVALAAVTVA